MMRFWKKESEESHKAKRKPRVTDDNQLMRNFNQLLLQRERLHKKFVDEAWRLEKKRSREPPHYVR